MEGSESPERRNGGGGGGGGAHLGVNKANKISKVVKRSVIQPPKPQAPVYTIDKNDFRIIVQKLTGSPAATCAPPQPPVTSAPPPPPPPPPSPMPPNPSRLQRARPPPLQSVQSFNKLVSNLTPITTIPPPSYHSSSFTTASSSSGNFTFRPTPNPAFQFPAPPRQFSVSAFQLPPPSNFNISAAFSRPPPLMAPPPPLRPPSAALQSAAPPLFSSQPQFLSFSPLPSPSSQVFGGSQVPFSPGSIFPLSPSGHFGYPGAGAGPLPPPSPGSFPLSPGQFPFTSF